MFGQNGLDFVSARQFQFLDAFFLHFLFSSQIRALTEFFQLLLIALMFFNVLAQLFAARKETGDQFLIPFFHTLSPLKHPDQEKLDANDVSKMKG